MIFYDVCCRGSRMHRDRTSKSIYTCLNRTGRLSQPKSNWRGKMRWLLLPPDTLCYEVKIWHKESLVIPRYCQDYSHTQLPLLMSFAPLRKPLRSLAVTCKYVDGLVRYGFCRSAQHCTANYGQCAGPCGSVGTRFEPMHTKRTLHERISYYIPMVSLLYPDIIYVIISPWYSCPYSGWIPYLFRHFPTPGNPSGRLCSWEGSPSGCTGIFSETGIGPTTKTGSELTGAAEAKIK